MKKLVSLAVVAALVFNLVGPQIPLAYSASNPDTRTSIEAYDDTARFNVNTDNKKEGAGAASVSNTGTGNILTAVESFYAQPKDLSFYADKADAYVHIWLYLENAAWFNNSNEAYLELSSGGAWNSGVARYDLTDQTLLDGWNELFLSVSGFQRHSDPAVTALDWSKVNYTRLYLFSQAPDTGAVSQTMLLDDLSIGLASDFTMPAGTRKPLENFDKANGYPVNTGDKKEGDAAAGVTATGAGSVLTLMERIYTQTKDLSFYAGREDAYVHVWVYLENAAWFNSSNDAWLELSSGGAWNSGVTRYNLAQEELKDGWNELFIPLGEFKSHSDPNVTHIDWANVNYTRLYLFTLAPTGGEVSQTLRVDDLSIGLKSDFTIPATDTLRNLESFENPARFPVDTANKKEGSGSAVVSATGTGNVLTLVESIYTQTKDLSFYAGREDAYVHAWVYLENAAWFNSGTDGYLEIGSGGAWNAGIARYRLADRELKDGWNELFIPVGEFVPHSDPNVTPCDWSKVNYVRLYLFTMAPGGGEVSQTLRVDDLSIGLKSDFTIPATDTLRNLESFENPARFPVDTENKKEGAGSAMVTATGGGNVLTMMESYFYQTKDLSFYAGREDAKLRLWLYVKDASLIASNQDMFLEFSSGGSWAAEIARYNLAGTTLKDGWNELYLPMNGFQPHSDPNVTHIDWSRVNYSRLYLFSAGAGGAEITQTIGMDGMYIGLTTDFDVPPESTMRPIESFDSPNRFPVDTENKKEGSGSAVVKGSGEGDVLTFLDSAYATPKNLTRYIQGKDAYIHLWVYLKDASVVSREADGYLEFGSGGAWNSQISRYDVTGLDFKDGWNELLVPVKDFQPHSDPNVGACDWSAVNYIRLYLFSTALDGGHVEQTLNLDDLSIGLRTDYPDANPVNPLPETTLKKLEGYDNQTKFTIQKDHKEGTGSAVAKAAGKGDVLTAVESIYTKPKDLSAYEKNPDAVFHFWIYLENAKLLNRELDGYLEIGSGGAWNAGIARADLTGFAFKDGWNELLLPASAFQRHGDQAVTSCDWSNINYIRLYLFSSLSSGGDVSQTMAIDGLYVGLRSDFPKASTAAPLYKDGAYRVIESFDDARRFSVSTENKKQGSAAAMVAAAGTGDVLTAIETAYTKPKDLSSYLGQKDAMVHLWLYVRDASVINRELDGYLELGSGGGWDSGITRVDITQFDLKSGWNELLIPVGDFQRHSDPAVTPCDWSKINYLRLYLFSAQSSGGEVSQSIGLDDLSIGPRSAFKGVNPVKSLYPNGSVRLIESYDDARKFQVDTTNKKEGYGAAMVSATGEGNVLTLIESPYVKPKNLSSFVNMPGATIHFWLYLKDAAAFNRTTDAYLEFGSGGGWDSKITRFNMAALEDLQDGWNEISIPISGFKAHSDPEVGACDWSGVNYIRVYVFSSAPDGGTVSQTMGIDGLSIGRRSDFPVKEKTEVTLVEGYDDPHRFTVNTEDFKQGTGAAMAATEGAGNLITAIETSYSYTKDLSETYNSADGCIAFWLYIKDAKQFNRQLDGFLEFSSGGFWGANVARFDTTLIDLNDGWNRVVIPVSRFHRSPDPAMEECDWSNINYIRFYLFNTIPGGSEAQTLMIDDLSAGPSSAFLMDGEALPSLKSNAAMASDGYAKTGTEPGEKAAVPVSVWILAGAGGLVVIAAATITIVAVRRKNRKKKDAAQA